MGLRLLVVRSLEQQEGALSQPISKSSSDTAQPFSPPASPQACTVSGHLCLSLDSTGTGRSFSAMLGWCLHSGTTPALPQLRLGARRG